MRSRHLLELAGGYTGDERSGARWRQCRQPERARSRCTAGRFDSTADASGRRRAGDRPAHRAGSRWPGPGSDRQRRLALIITTSSIRAVAASLPELQVGAARGSGGRRGGRRAPSAPRPSAAATPPVAVPGPTDSSSGVVDDFLASGKHSGNAG